MADHIRVKNKEFFLEFTKYLLASGFALIIDYVSYLYLVTNNILSIPLAAIFGYSIGLVAAYFLISKKVFRDGWLKQQKKVEGFLFFLSGLWGIFLTYITVKLTIYIVGNNANLAKFSAIVISFFGAYIFRKFLVFKRSGI